MSDERHPPSKDYIECARRLRKLHALIRSGYGDSDKAEQLRDEMDDFWIRMSHEERKWTDELSADLHILGEHLPVSYERSTDGATRQKLLDAGRRDDWPEIRSLFLTDVISVDHFDRILFRAIYWAALKDFESSLEFLEALAGRVEEIRSEIEVRQSVLEQHTQPGQTPEQIAFVHGLAQVALQKLDQAVGEIGRLISDVRMMHSQELAGVSDPIVWGAVKERFFQAEEHVKAFSLLAPLAA